MNCTYLDETGKQRPVYMGSYGIGVGRLLASVVEEYHDEYGIVWPPQIAPYDVHLVDLATDPGHAAGIRERLESAGFSVLYDDRDERAGVKFNDADLIGLPIRITVGEKALAEKSVEVKIRWEKDTSMIPIDGLEARVTEIAGQIDEKFSSRYTPTAEK
jgi:prolyl-tRNA synthetase